MPSFDANMIINAIESIVPQDGIIALHEPCFNGNEWGYVEDRLAFLCREIRRPIRVHAV